MNPETFVSRIRSAVVDQNLATYRELFESTSPDAANDPYWKRALTLYKALSEPQRTVLLEIMRQASVDSVSNIFGILDGSSTLDGAQENFVLTSNADNRKINGQLQDLFLGADENGR